MNWRAIGNLFKTTFEKFGADKVSRMAAALAFYTALALAPLLLVAVSVASVIVDNLGRFGEFSWLEASESPRVALVEQIEATVGPEAASIARGALDSAGDRRQGVAAGVVSFAALLFSASGLFNQFRDALDAIWRVPPEERSGVVAYTLGRLYASIGVLVVGLLLFASILLGVAVAVVSRRLTDLVPEAFADVVRLAPLLDFTTSLIVLTLMFTVVFKVVPKPESRWSDVFPAAVLTTLLFIAGKSGLSFYLSTSAPGSTYGAAGSILVLLIWVYYTGQIILFGAEFAYVYTFKFGSRRATAAATLALAPAANLPASTAMYAQTAATPQPTDEPTERSLWQFTVGVAMFVAGLIVGVGQRRWIKR